MSTPLSVPQPDQPRLSPSNGSTPLPADGPSTPSASSSAGPSQPAAGPSRTTQGPPSLPNLDIPPSSLTSSDGAAAGNGTSGANGEGQTHQARLALAQQQLKDFQQGALRGASNPDGTVGGASMSGANAEAMLRQLHAMQASRIRQGHQTTMGQAQLNGQPTSAASPANGSSRPSTSEGPGPSRSAQSAEAAATPSQSGLANPANNASPSTPRTPSHPNPNLAANPSANAQRPPNAQASRAAVANQRQQFIQSLANYYKTNNIPPPVEVFNGERDGAVKVGGVWVDLVDLFMAIMRAQGLMNAIKQPPDSPTWANLISARGIPNPFPEPLSIPRPPNAPPNTPIQQTTNPVQYLVGVYVAYIKGFEDDMQRKRLAIAQQRQAAAAAMKVQPPVAQSPASAASPAITSTPAQHVPSTPINAATPMNAPTPTAATPSVPMAPTPAAQTPAASFAGNGLDSASAFAQATPGMTAPSPAMSTMLHHATPQMAHHRPGVPHQAPTPIDTAAASFGSVQADPASSTPSSAKKRNFEEAHPAKRPSSPKRQRYKVEYKPIHIPMTGLAGWDERAVQSTFPKRNLTHASHSIHDLAIVDMEAILMGLRSRLPRELGYAITALSMLSMPHPEDNLDGLPLVHLVEIFGELLALLEEAAFGEDGYDAWEKKMTARTDAPAIDIAKLDFMEFEQIGRHLEISLPQDPMGSDLWRKDKTGGSTDIILSVVNLLRNFSLFEENRGVMGDHPALLPILARLLDTRLVRVPGWSTPDEPYSFIEYATVTRDVIMILTNVGRFTNLSAAPFACVQTVFRTLARNIKSGLEVCNQKDSPFGSSIDVKPAAPPTVISIYRAAEAFYSLAGPDSNREVLGRMPDDELVGLYDSLVKLLPVTHRQMGGLVSVDTHLIYFECLALGLYSLAFLAPLSARAKMRAIPGASTVIRRIITHMMPRNPTFAHNPHNVICRRLAETLGVLNGTMTCSGEGMATQSMGFSATAGQGKGWSWSSGVVESGWMASDCERIMECLMVHGVDKNMFAELDALWWADGDGSTRL